MESPVVKIISIDKVTHNVVRIIIEKPAGYAFSPGQATEIAINKAGWKEERRPFTFTSLPGDDHLEFTIKTYPERKGVTNEILNLVPGDELILHDVWGAITYKGEGAFIAGGAGVTPFLSILRDLGSRNEVGNNLLIFANKARADIIHEDELRSLLGNSFINILSQEEVPGYAHGRITLDFLKSHISDLNKPFYVCGPPSMIESIQKHLVTLGVGEHLLVVEI